LAEVKEEKKVEEKPRELSEEEIERGLENPYVWLEGLGKDVKSKGKRKKKREEKRKFKARR
jgi:hypothetical protein